MSRSDSQQTRATRHRFPFRIRLQFPFRFRMRRAMATDDGGLATEGGIGRMTCGD